MRLIISAGVALALAGTVPGGAAFAQGVPATPPAAQAACPGNPDALGTARTIAIDPKTSQLLGRQQYAQTLPLQKGEVVLTFDDGPLSPMTSRVLDALAKECVKATFFIVGTMANAQPGMVRKIAAEGHTIGTHSQSHPLIFPKLTQEAGVEEIEKGIASVTAALKPAGVKPAPWFRFPGLGRTKFYEAYAREHGLAIWSVDTVADDWLRLKPEEVEKRAIERLEARSGGVLLLHDIQPSTAVMLPSLLRQLKARGFSIVHVVPAGDGMVASLPGPGPSGRMPGSTPPVATSAPAVTSGEPARPAQPRLAAPAPRPAAGAAPGLGAPQDIPARAAPRGETAEEENPFVTFWPRLWTDMTNPKEAR
ncbi:polysaccharide deacetylase family protein [Xanthobacteraceae bacterium A53D]